mmetsp:Transcript_1160/g.3204  ORF Transcript_1160/g.3204 Transcript_1160/m.3204 type:complete len:349 (+) Transcript_1160:1155-2201(+)
MTCSPESAISTACKLDFDSSKESLSPATASSGTGISTSSPEGSVRRSTAPGPAPGGTVTSNDSTSDSSENDVRVISVRHEGSTEDPRMGSEGEPAKAAEPSSSGGGQAPPSGDTASTSASAASVPRGVSATLRAKKASWPAPAVGSGAAPLAVLGRVPLFPVGRAERRGVRGVAITVPSKGSSSSSAVRSPPGDDGASASIGDGLLGPRIGEPAPGPPPAPRVESRGECGSSSSCCICRFLPSGSGGLEGDDFAGNGGICSGSPRSRLPSAGASRSSCCTIDFGCGTVDSSCCCICLLDAAELAPAFVKPFGGPSNEGAEPFVSASFPARGLRGLRGLRATMSDSPPA